MSPNVTATFPTSLSSSLASTARAVGPPRGLSGRGCRPVCAQAFPAYLAAWRLGGTLPSFRRRDLGCFSETPYDWRIVPSPYADENFFRALLSRAVGGKASDVHIKVGQPPGARIRGEMVYFRTEKVAPEDTTAVAHFVITNADVLRRLDDLKEYDTSYMAPGIGRFRVNVYRQRASLAVVMRFIPTEVPTIESLGLPLPVTRELAERQNGMVFVVGAAGNGKSTSIASMVAHLNATQALHIVTIEDPIEFLHQDAMSSISQREVGLDTESFTAALRAAMRQDPDVIFVGEIRDEETMEIALKAGETGHLVLATLHTSDAVRTVNRMLAMMRGDANDNRVRIASSLQGVIAQRLLPRADGTGVVLAAEVLVASQSVKESIRRPENNPPLKSLMEKGTHPYGMETFQMSVSRLLEEGLIDEFTASEATGT
jgi:twitching motility protein PilT